MLNKQFELICGFQNLIQLGIYYVYWEELVRVFPRTNILVLQNEGMRDATTTMTTTFKFLGLRKFTNIYRRKKRK